MTCVVRLTLVRYIRNATQLGLRPTPAAMTTLVTIATLVTIVTLVTIATLTGGMLIRHRSTLKVKIRLY